jgi:hypothetical protein
MTERPQRRSGRGSREGFVATFLVISILSSILIGSVGSSAAAISYADSIALRENRIRAGLYAQSCVSWAEMSFAHDYFFMARGIAVRDLSCTVVSATRSGDALSIVALGVSNGIVATSSVTALDTGRSISELGK